MVATACINSFQLKTSGAHPDHRGFPDQIVQPWKKLGDGDVICLIWGTIQYGIQKNWLGQEQVNVSLMQVYGLGLNLDSSEMVNALIYINKYKK